MATKIKPADTWLSKCVKLAASYTCEKCGAVHDESSKGLHSHHVVPRNVRRLRWYKGNLICLCFKCHRWAHDYPYESGDWIKSNLGKGAFELLMEKRNEYVKIPKAEEKEIAKHYRQEFNLMVETGSKEFTSY
ncbi:Bacteriophage Lambda NinG protein [uncultured Thiomicrorhabdus sp.]